MENHPHFIPKQRHPVMAFLSCAALQGTFGAKAKLIDATHNENAPVSDRKRWSRWQNPWVDRCPQHACPMRLSSSFRKKVQRCVLQYDFTKVASHPWRWPPSWFYHWNIWKAPFSSEISQCNLTNMTLMTIRSVNDITIISSTIAINQFL